MNENENRIFTQTSACTPMGDLMRRYWQPFAGVTQMDNLETKAVRLMGEDLVLYKDLSGNYGLIDRQCAHRRADLSYGFVEKEGLRCNYHGWLYGADGHCIEQPFEETANPASNQKERIRIKNYRVQAHAGLLWAYMGPEPAPLVPNWEPFTWKNGFVQIVISEVPCNWFQGQENSIDPVHFEWMHDNWGMRLKGKVGETAPKHKKIDFEESDYGIQYKRVREGGDESHPLWIVGRVCLWPNALFTGNHFEFRVPIDDDKMLSVGWFFSRVPKEREPYDQKSIPCWTSPVRDEKTGRWITSHIMNQDFVAWVGQGQVADRTKEHLGVSDRGIVMMRRRFLSDMEVIAKGGDPKAIIRDPKVNECVRLPIAAREELVEGLSIEKIKTLKPGENLSGAGRREFPFLVGQPEEVKRAYLDAMGY